MGVFWCHWCPFSLWHVRKQAAACDPFASQREGGVPRAEGSAPAQRWVQGDLCSGWARGPKDHRKRWRTAFPLIFPGLSLGTRLCDCRDCAGRPSAWLEQIPSSDTLIKALISFQGTGFALLPLYNGELHPLSSPFPITSFLF